MKEEAMLARPDYKFRTDRVTFTVLKSKEGKKYYVTGYISTSDIDIYNDLVTPNGLKSMLKQINESVITLDYEHENFRDDETILPVGRIVEAELDEKGLWVKCELNSNSPKFKNLWGSIKDGFVNSFSIAFQPLKTVTKKVKDADVRLIEDLKLLNVALTGIPVNKSAVMTDFGMKSVMQKAIAESEDYGEQVVVPKRLLNKLMEEKSMSEEEVKTESAPEAPEAEAKPEEAAPVEASEGEEAQAEEAAEGEAQAVEEPAVEEAPAQEAQSVEQKNMENVVNELKSMVEKQGEELKAAKKAADDATAELKALKETKVFKSPVPEKAAVEEKSQPIDMISRI